MSLFDHFQNPVEVRTKFTGGLARLWLTKSPTLHILNNVDSEGEEYLWSKCQRESASGWKQIPRRRREVRSGVRRGERPRERVQVSSSGQPRYRHWVKNCKQFLSRVEPRINSSLFPTGKTYGPRFLVSGDILSDGLCIGVWDRLICYIRELPV